MAPVLNRTIIPLDLWTTRSGIGERFKTLAMPLSRTILRSLTGGGQTFSIVAIGEGVCKADSSDRTMAPHLVTLGVTSGQGSEAIVDVVACLDTEAELEVMASSLRPTSTVVKKVSGSSETSSALSPSSIGLAVKLVTLSMSLGKSTRGVLDNSIGVVDEASRVGEGGEAGIIRNTCGLLVSEGE